MKFYVTMIRGQRVAWLAGPFPSKDAADLMVRPAMDAAIEVDPWAHFDAFGVTGRERGPNSAKAGMPYPAGVLNERLGLKEEVLSWH